ncbi:metal dependent phosphohydrolase [Ammonifex degensii KC4]|uniref:Metal dependent phosphohydrolase n=1 Tax=Ammonifex degensii (strain DSM 10501 / KC4) TaxID=429009 RepID=C9RCG2_AMMDK|nr:HD domain-containing phosphohydrolase [Ammonifex degensii]ACX51939.1 metal dependent phosphohydrolase [Ammonifex degensii KC4]
MSVLEHVAKLPSLWEAASAMRKWSEGLFRHSLLVADLAAEVAEALGFSRQEVELARLGGLLHDFGKVTWPREMAHKHPLLDEDRELVRLHPLVGAKLVEERVPGVSGVVLRVIREHHERDGGNGYPRGLRAPDLHPLSRVVACVEVFAALTERRSYRPVDFTPEQAFAVLHEDGFDGELIDALRRVLSGREGAARPAPGAAAGP